MAVPWREKKPGLTSNYEAALHRLVKLENSLRRQGETAEPIHGREWGNQSRRQATTFGFGPQRKTPHPSPIETQCQ